MFYQQLSSIQAHYSWTSKDRCLLIKKGSLLQERENFSSVETVIKSKGKKNCFYLKENLPGLKAKVSSTQVKSINQKKTGFRPDGE